MDENEIIIFDLYFANLVAITMHPGYTKTEALTLEQIAEIADECMKIRRKRCHLPQQ